MTLTLDWDQRLLQLAHPYAVVAVLCPKCHARPGQRCQSTGGGNPCDVAPHSARRVRIADWTEQQLAAADKLVRAQGLTAWWSLPDGYYAATEAAAAPIVVKSTKTYTPKSVPLSEPQAERIEWAAQAVGVYTVSRVHFHGDALDRASIQALEAKGILRFVYNTADGYDRVMALTPFGWQVYRQHRLVIRRLDDNVIAAYEAATPVPEHTH